MLLDLEILEIGDVGPSFHCSLGPSCLPLTLRRRDSGVGPARVAPSFIVALSSDMSPLSQPSGVPAAIACSTRMTPPQSCAPKGVLDGQFQIRSMRPSQRQISSVGDIEPRCRGPQRRTAPCSCGGRHMTTGVGQSGHADLTSPSAAPCRACRSRPPIPVYPVQGRGCINILHSSWC